MELSVHEAKKQLRKAVSAKLKTLSEEYRTLASEQLRARVLSPAEYREAQRIFLYINMPTEPQTGGIIRQALADGKQVYVPKCISKTDMLAVRIRSTDQLVPGAYNIPEPVDCSETLEPDAFDLILVPCVSASADGRRLGHGAGYYDRFLEGNAERTICLCFAQAMCEDIPVDENDVRMHRVISEA